MDFSRGYIYYLHFFKNAVFNFNRRWQACSSFHVVVDTDVLLLSISHHEKGRHTFVSEENSSPKGLLLGVVKCANLCISLLL